jgi:hypothetical protein
MGEHALDREMRLARVGRAEDGGNSPAPDGAERAGSGAFWSHREPKIGVSDAICNTGADALPVKGSAAKANGEPPKYQCVDEIDAAVDTGLQYVNGEKTKGARIANRINIFLCSHTI